MLNRLGIHNVDVIEPRVERASLALRLGARSINAPQAAIDGTYTIGFECSSRNAAFELLQKTMRREGRICILSDGNIEPLVLSPHFHEKELTIVGSSDGLNYQEHAKWYFTVVREHAHTLEQLFGYRTTANDLIRTFERLASGTIASVKVLAEYPIDMGSE
jgi:alcohol dehydrogenase